MTPNVPIDFTQGPVGGHLIRMALPVIAGQLVILLYCLADNYFVSQIDPSETWLISGMGLIFPLFFMFIALAQGLSTGTASMVARAIGNRDTSALERAGDSALFLAIGGLFITGILFFWGGASIVSWIAGSSLSSRAVQAGQTFLFWLTPGLALLLVNQALAGVLQGEGKMMITFAASGLSTLFNIVLDPILIFGFHMGIAGAGLATSLALFVSTGILLAALMKGDASIRVHFRISQAKASILAEIVRVGAPQALNMLSLSLGFLIINYGVSSLGEGVMNAWALVGRADDLILMVAYGLSAALLTLVGQNAAAGQWSRVKAALRTAISYGTVACLVLALGYMILARPLFSLLSSNPSVITLCSAQVNAVSWSYAGVVVSIIVNALFLGLGRPWPGVVMTFVRMEAVLVPGILILEFALGQTMGTLLPFFAVVNLLSLPLTWWWGESVLRRTEGRPSKSL